MAAGVLAGYALRADGTVWAWGHDGCDELGNGTTTSSLSPVQVTGLSNVTQIDAKGYEAYALRSDGTVWGWGLDAGTLGTGAYGGLSMSTPVRGRAPERRRRRDAYLYRGVSRLGPMNADSGASKTAEAVNRWFDRWGAIAVTVTVATLLAFVAALVGELFLHPFGGRPLYGWGNGLLLLSAALVGVGIISPPGPARRTRVAIAVLIAVGWFVVLRFVFAP